MRSSSGCSLANASESTPPITNAPPLPNAMMIITPTNATAAPKKE